MHTQKENNEMGDVQANGWNEWSRHVLAELVRLNNEIIRLNESLDSASKDISKSVENIRAEHKDACDCLRKDREKAISEMKKEQMVMEKEIASLRTSTRYWSAAIGAIIPTLFGLLAWIANSYLH